MNNLNEAEKAALRKAILSTEFQMQLGAGEWDLTEEEENSLCDLTDRLKQEQQAED